eukprot:4230120-Pleurochrysis_carterae.AAC.1
MTSDIARPKCKWTSSKTPRPLAASPVTAAAATGSNILIHSSFITHPGRQTKLPWRGSAAYL